MDFDHEASARRDAGAADLAEPSVEYVIDITDAALEAHRAQVNVPRQRVAEPDPLELIPTLPSHGTLAERIQRAPLTAAQSPRLAAVARRTVDIGLSLFTLIVFAPVMAALAILIRLDSRGPAVFMQDRVAMGGGTFRFAKFRTMYVDARERFPELYAYQYTSADIRSMKFKLPQDPRLTRVGRWLRRTSLDELPNLFNVLRGDMTLVGPRPEIPEMTDYYEPHQLAKFSVKPGLTGLAQTRGRNILTFQQTLSADLEYVRTRSLALDIRILFRTVWTVAVQFGAL